MCPTVISFKASCLIPLASEREEVNPVLDNDYTKRSCHEELGVQETQKIFFS